MRAYGTYWAGTSLKLKFDSTVWKIEGGNIQIQKYTGQIIGYDTISE